MVVLYNILLVNLVSGTYPVHVFTVSMLGVVCWIVVIAVFFDNLVEIFQNLVFLLVFIYLNIYTFYKREYHRRKIRNLDKLAKLEI
jgi:hypothetical protein